MNPSLQHTSHLQLLNTFDVYKSLYIYVTERHKVVSQPADVFLVVVRNASRRELLPSATQLQLLLKYLEHLYLAAKLNLLFLASYRRVTVLSVDVVF